MQLGRILGSGSNFIMVHLVYLCAIQAIYWHTALPIPDDVISGYSMESDHKIMTIPLVRMCLGN